MKSREYIPYNFCNTFLVKAPIGEFSHLQYAPQFNHFRKPMQHTFHCSFTNHAPHPKIHNTPYIHRFTLLSRRNPTRSCPRFIHFYFWRTARRALTKKQCALACLFCFGVSPAAQFCALEPGTDAFLQGAHASSHVFTRCACTEDSRYTIKEQSNTASRTQTTS